MNKKNPEGYSDPTAYGALVGIVKQESEMDRKVHQLVHIIRDICSLCGFEVVGRITFRHKKSGKEFR